MYVLINFHFRLWSINTSFELCLYLHKFIYVHDVLLNWGWLLPFKMMQSLRVLTKWIRIVIQNVIKKRSLPIYSNMLYIHNINDIIMLCNIVFLSYHLSVFFWLCGENCISNWRKGKKQNNDVNQNIRTTAWVLSLRWDRPLLTALNTCI